MRQIGTLIGKRSPVRTYAQDDRWPAPTLHIGVELEMEGMFPAVRRHSQPNGFNYWQVDRDGSLDEHGVELRLAEPLSGVDLTKAMEELRVLFSKLRPHPQNGLGSTHIHVDMRDASVQDAVQALFLSAILEPLLFEFMEAPERAELNFCLPVTYSFPLLHTWGICLHEDREDSRLPWGDVMVALRDSTPKYSATSGVHLFGAGKWGTVEFRHGRALSGKNADPDLLELWIKAAMCIRLATQGRNNLLTAQWYRDISDLTPKALLDQVFGPCPDVLARMRELLPGNAGTIMANLRAVEEAVFTGAGAADSLRVVAAELGLQPKTIPRFMAATTPCDHGEGFIGYDDLIQEEDAAENRPKVELDLDELDEENDEILLHDADLEDPEEV